MPDPKVGEIWTVLGTTNLAVVVFARPSLAGEPDDVRVIPVYRGLDRGLVTSRDLVLPGDQNTLGVSLFAFPWNARRLESRDLAEVVGSVTKRAVSALRVGEFRGLIPVEESADFMAWRGQDGDDALLLAIHHTQQRLEINRWDGIESRLPLYRSMVEIVFEKVEYCANGFRRDKGAAPFFVQPDMATAEETYPADTDDLLPQAA